MILLSGKKYTCHLGHDKNFGSEAIHFTEVGKFYFPTLALGKENGLSHFDTCYAIETLYYAEKIFSSLDMGGILKEIVIRTADVEHAGTGNDVP